MSTHSKRLRSGVRELVRTEETTLEDLHMVATDVIAALDKLSSKIVRKLKSGQSIRIYDEDSNREYGQKGSDIPCFFIESYDTKARGTTLKVYDDKNEWIVGLDCLLEVFEEFDPESDEGKKRNNNAKPKRRGRKPKVDADAHDEHEFDTQWQDQHYEPETEGEEYDFTNPNWGAHFDNE
jgi:hypothetical protein